MRQLVSFRKSLGGVTLDLDMPKMSGIDMLQALGPEN
jgi:FixJ family two-component response regulator